MFSTLVELRKKSVNQTSVFKSKISFKRVLGMGKIFAGNKESVQKWVQRNIWVLTSKVHVIREEF